LGATSTCPAIFIADLTGHGAPGVRSGLTGCGHSWPREVAAIADDADRGYASRAAGGDTSFRVPCRHTTAKDSISPKHATANALPPPSAGKRKALPRNTFITVDDFGNKVEINAS
jgi:hypothetical protein